MKIVRILSLLLPLVFAAPAFAQLDLSQEVLNIPDTHDVKPYVWNVMRKPSGIRAVLSPESGVLNENSFRLEIQRDSTTAIQEMHVFITDDDLRTYTHLRPAAEPDGVYHFAFTPPFAGTYRFEVVFRSAGIWIDIPRDLKLSGKPAPDAITPDPADSDYRVDVTMLPKVLYSEHTGTFLYHLFYKGEPLRALDSIHGSDMEAASWDENLDDFVYMTPKQNLGGPDVAISMVFMNPGGRAVFGEFSHKGVIRHVESVIRVRKEQRSDPSAIENIGPAD